MINQAMTNQPYLQVSLPLGEENFELAVALLMSEGYESFLEENDTLHAYIPEPNWSAEKKSELESLLDAQFGKKIPFTTETLAPQNWNAEWEATLKPIEVSDHLVIVQHGKDYPKKPNQIAIEINPKMSFGTGYHETTRLMLREMTSLVKPSDTIFDIGAGTAVLAIAARKLGNNNPILASDNDAWAVENAKENVSLNHADAITVIQSDAETELEKILSEQPFSLILANINRPIHDKILPVIAAKVPSARVLISGILKFDEPWLNALLKRIGFKLEKKSEEGDWLCALISKNV
jgi:ribosomal protein L11 methyltransferase